MRKLGKKFKLEEIPGVGIKIAEKLREVGFSEPMSIAVCSPSELASIAEIGEGQSSKIINAVRQMLEIGFEPASKIFERKTKALKITTGARISILSLVAAYILRQSQKPMESLGLVKLSWNFN